jgi:UDP-N-acetylmuramate--alanine ligase
MSKKIHILGIGGAGLSGIAKLLFEQGNLVSGSDKVINDNIAHLKNFNIQVYPESDNFDLTNIDILLISSAIKEENPILQKARQLKKEIITRHDLWQLWSHTRSVIAVCGSHGKTTVTTFLARMIDELNLDFGYLCGYQGPDSAKWGKEGELFVIEADEYAKTLLSLQPKYLSINNIDWDHVDIYPTKEDYLNVFLEIGNKTVDNEGIIIYNADDTNCLNVINKLENKDAIKITFGIKNKADYSAQDIVYKETSTEFNLFINDKFKGSIEIKLNGLHNVYNTLNCIAILMLSGIRIEEIVKQIGNYTGAYRRMQLVYNQNDIKIYNDYAHAPKEISAVLEGLKLANPNKRIIPYFQPHSFNRLKNFYSDYLKSFNCLENADLLIVGSVYAARDNEEYFDYQKFINNIETKSYKLFAKDNNDALEIITNELKLGDILIILSAGNGSLVIDKLVPNT